MLTTRNKNYLIGISLILAYVLMAAIREVLFAKTLHELDIFILIPIAFGIAVAFFLPMQLLKSKSFFSKVKANLYDILYLNLTTAIMWFAFIFALKFIEPAIVSSINSALMPIATLVFGVFMIKGSKIDKWDIGSALGILLSIAFLIYAVVTGHAGNNQEVESKLIICGVAGALISGTVTAINNIVTKRLLTAGMTSSELMSVRFFLLIIGCLAWVLWKSIPVNLDLYQFSNVAIISFIGIVIPLFCVQIGIAKSDVNSTALLVSLTPVLTFVVQTYDGGFQFSYYSLTGICLAVAFVVFGIVAKFRKMKEASR